MFYKNKKVVVTGSGNSAMTAALHLAEIAESVTLIVRGEVLKGEVVWMENVKNNPKIKIMFNTNIKDLRGDNKLTEIVVEANGKEDNIICDGLFVEVGSEPDSQITKDLKVELDEKGYIKVNRDQSTNIPGFYAAGDITDGSNGLHQIISACAEGAVASAAIFKYLRGGK
jgi:thioredoxin reductase (NADPH)